MSLLNLLASASSSCTFVSAKWKVESALTLCERPQEYGKYLRVALSVCMLPIFQFRLDAELLLGR